MTLTRAVVHVGDAFAFGQVYVALSRLRDMQGLWLLSNIDRRTVKSHPAVKVFYGDAPPAASSSSSHSNSNSNMVRFS